jgi:hypothetical protein
LNASAFIRFVFFACQFTLGDKKIKWQGHTINDSIIPGPRYNFSDSIMPLIFGFGLTRTRHQLTLSGLYMAAIEYQSTMIENNLQLSHLR